MQFRYYQDSAVKKVRDSIRRGVRRVLLYSPTGSGKTMMAGEIMRLANEKDKRVTFVVNRVTLVKQASKHLRKTLELPHGIIQGDNTWNTHRPLLLCSIQTLARRGFPNCDLVLIDEAHGAVSPTYKNLIEHYGKLGVPIIGLSATPFTRGLANVFDELVVAATIPELIEKGFLVDCDIFAPPGPDLSGVPVVRGDYDEKKLGKAVDKQALVGDIVDHWMQLGIGRSTVVFATNILHSQHIVAEFLARGISAEHLDCYTDEEEREAMLARFDNGETTVLSCVSVLAEGWDSPRATVMILARPTKSLTRYIQMAGRILRPFDGKTRALILDHSTTSHNLGYPTDELPLELDDGECPNKAKKRDKEIKLPHPCPSCHFLVPVGVYPCPKCGFEIKAQNKIFTEEGSLTKLERKYLFTSEERQEFWSGCLGLAEKRKRSRQWAKFLYHDITRAWPNGLEDIATEPCKKVLDRDKHNRIRYAKGKFRSNNDR